MLRRHSGCERPGAAFQLSASPGRNTILTDFSDGLARLPALPLGRLLVIAVPLHVANQPLTLTEALEPLEHLLDRLVAPRSDLNHEKPPPRKKTKPPPGRHHGHPGKGRASYPPSSAPARPENRQFYCRFGAPAAPNPSFSSPFLLPGRKMGACNTTYGHYGS